MLSIRGGHVIKTKKQGLLIVLSGPSGCGKNTVCNDLKNKIIMYGNLFL